MTKHQSPENDALKPLLALRAERAVFEKEVRSAVTWTLDYDEEAQRLLDQVVTLSEYWSSALNRLRSKFYSDNDDPHSYGAQTLAKFKKACIAVAKAEAAMVPRSAVPERVEYAIRYHS